MCLNVLTVCPSEPPEAGKGGEGGDNGIGFGHMTNADFLADVFPLLPDSAFVAVCSKPGNPEIGGWGAQRAGDVAAQ